jgi:hypothetical protein
VPAPLIEIVALRWRQHREEGQRPHPGGLGCRNQEHHANPPRAARFDEEALA